MVICIIGLVVFSILGLFSAHWRKLAKEAFHCVYRTMTLRPCETGFDQRLKASITSKAMGLSPSIGKIVFKYFKQISWIFVFAFFASTAAVGYGIYNYWAFGNCNGPQSSAFCVFNEIAGKNGISINDVSTLNHPVRGNPSAPINIIEFACLQCPYSKEAEPVVRQVLDAYPDKVKLTFFFFPLPQHRNGQLTARAAMCAAEQGKFWEYHDLLFEKQSTFDNSVDATTAAGNMKKYAVQAGVNSTKFDDCLDNLKTQNRVLDDYDIGKKLGLQGTPTFFIGDTELVGPQTFETFKAYISQ